MSADHKNRTRRELLGAMGVLAAGTTAGCIGTLTGRNELEKQFDEIRAETKKYDGAPKKAIDDGYDLFGPAVPNMGWHFVNNGLIDAAIQDGFDITEPQLLVYDAEFNLGGVEYSAPAAAVDVPDLFADENADETEEWGIHKASTHLFATQDDEVQEFPKVDWETRSDPHNWMEFHPPNNDLEPGMEVTRDFGHGKETRTIDLALHHPDLRTLHAWVFVENPNGPFEPVHPEFAQSFAGEGHEH